MNEASYPNQIWALCKCTKMALMIQTADIKESPKYHDSWRGEKSLENWKFSSCANYLVSAVPHGAALAADDGGGGEPLRGLRGEVQREREHQVLGGVHRGEPHTDPALVVILNWTKQSSLFNKSQKISTIVNRLSCCPSFKSLCINQSSNSLVLDSSFPLICNWERR